MNTLFPQPDQIATAAPYIVTMQIQTAHLRAFSVGATTKRLIPVLESAVTHPPVVMIRSNKITARPIQQVDKQQKAEQAPLRSHRSNEEWVSELSNGELSNSCAPAVQQKAHEELCNYLYVVAYNYLQKRTNDIQRLNAYKVEEIVELAKDFVQSFMLKLVKDEYALLDKYSAVGRFLSWAAQVITNLIASELRRPYWQKQYMPHDGLQVAWVIDEETVTPHNAVEIEEIGETLNRLLAQLSEQQRSILLRCFAEGERTTEVAEELGITTNALYINAHRAKAKMRKLLEKEGIMASELAIFNA